MQDVIIEGAHSSSKALNARKSGAGNKQQRGVFGFIFNWFFKGLFVALLLGIDFVLFATSGSNSIFADGFMLKPEIITILTGFLILSLLFMLIFSFSSFLQNLLVSLSVGAIVMAMLNQFAVYDKTSILVPMASPYLGIIGASVFDGISHYIIAGGAAVLTFLILFISSTASLAYFAATLLVVFIGIVADSYIVKDKNPEFRTSFDNHLQSKDSNGKKFVYLFLPNAGSYIYIGELSGRGDNLAKAQEVKDRMVAFLAKNRFTVYPNAYAFDRDPLMNVVESLNNIDDKKAVQHIQKNITIDSYWKFKNLPDEYVYLKDSKLIDVFKNSRYRTTAIQSRGINICNKNNDINVDKCIDKVNVPVSNEDMKLGMFDKVSFWIWQWLNSMHFTNDWSGVYSTVNTLANADQMPILGIPYDNLYVVNSFKTLDVLAEDLAKDHGNRAYFVFLDLPSDMYVYNEFCQIKPRDKWIAMTSAKWMGRLDKNRFEKREAYLDQTSCLIGKLEQFMQKLQENGAAKDTVIVLQGASGVGDIVNGGKTDDYIANFKSRNLVLMAIKDPAKDKFSVNNEICEAKTITQNYLYKRHSCIEMEQLDLFDNAKKDLQQNLMRVMLTNEGVKKAASDFEEWYKTWSAVNAGQPLPLKLPVTEPISEAIEVPDVQVDEVKVMEVPAAELPEAEVKPLGDIEENNEAGAEVLDMQNKAETETVPAVKEANEPVPEAPQIEESVIVKVK